MRLLFVQLALALFQIDLAVKHEMDEQPDGQPEQLLPGGIVGLKNFIIMEQQAENMWDICRRSFASAVR